MKKKISSRQTSRRIATTKVIGIRLPETLSIAVKKEAVLRSIRLNELFQEMWEVYKRDKREKNKPNDK
jgi:hypothetical protein